MSQQRRTPGRRFYNKQQTQTSFRQTTPSVGFSPIQAANEAAGIAEETKRNVEDLKTLGRAQRRQSDLNSGVLKAKQTIEQANLEASQKTLEGIMSLSQTALQGYELYTKEQEERRQDEEAMSFLLGDGTGSIVDEEGNATVTPQVAAGAEASQEEQNNAVVSETAIQQSVDGDQVLAEDVRQPSADAHSAARSRSLTVSQATVQVTPYLSEFAQSDTLIQRPDGTTFRANEAKDSSDLSLVLQLGLRQFVQENGLTGGDVRALRDQFLPVAQNAMVQVQSQRMGQIQTANQNARVEVAFETASATIQTGEYDINQVWTDLASDYWNSGKFNGDRAAANEAALRALVQIAVNQGDEALLEALRDTPKFTHENGTAGPRLSQNPAYEALIQKGIDDIRNNEWRDHTQTQRDQQIELEQAQAAHQQALLDADGNPEAIRAANEELRDRTLEIGGPRAREIYTTITRQGLNYNPLVYGELADATAQGDPPTRNDIQDLEERGVITPEEAKSLRQQAGITDDVAVSVTKPYDRIISQSVKGAINAQLADKGILPSGELKGALAPVAADVELQVRRQLAAWMEQNPDASQSQVNEQVALLVQATRKDNGVLSTLSINSDGEVEGYTYGDPTRVERATTTVTTNPNTGQEARVLTALTTTELTRLQTDANKDNDLDAYNDRLLTGEEFEAATIAIANNKPNEIPPRVRRMAELLNMTPKNLIYAQGVGQNIDVSALIEQAQQPEAAASAGTTDPNPNSEARKSNRYLQTVLGVPRRGAAYLTGNIMQESAWDGQRTPWVLDDGAGTNKGLISWNRDRITRIEGWSGKPIEQMTNREQMQAMMWEMENYYPAAYRVFMNPNATDAQLRRASFQYWGYGEEGARYEYAQDYL